MTPVVILLLLSASVQALRSPVSAGRLVTRRSLKEDKPSSEKDDDNWARIKEALDKADADPKGVPPPIYQPGGYGNRALAALAYVVPVVDAADLGKYMFEAYPVTAEVYNTLFGPLSAIYNGVPFLPFAVFFLLSYLCRAPTFPLEVRFHVAQAFMLSLFQFVPSLLFGLMEKGGVPGMGILYNTGNPYHDFITSCILLASIAFTWVLGSAFFMQTLLLNPLASTKNPFLLNVVGLSMKYMGYTSDLAPRK
jgi:hypothetical protein